MHLRYIRWLGEALFLGSWSWCWYAVCEGDDERKAEESVGSMEGCGRGAVVAHSAVDTRLPDSSSVPAGVPVLKADL